MERKQAECQCRAPSGNFFNCIVFSKLRKGRAARTSRDSRDSGGPVPPEWWLSARGWRSLGPLMTIRPAPNCRVENVVVDKSPTGVLSVMAYVNYSASLGTKMAYDVALRIVGG